MHSRSGAVAVPSEAPDHAVMAAQALTLCTIAWGALAFGAVYSWAYWPLAAASVASGAFAFWITRASGAGVDRVFSLALIVCVAAIAIQLVPVPRSVLDAIAPSSIDLLRRLDPAFAAGVVGWHPLSVWPSDTVTALVLFGSFALLLVGASRMLSVTGAQRFVEALTAFGAFLALVGIVQKPLYNGSIYGIWELELGRMPFGPFVNRNHFAGWMVMTLPLALALLSARIHSGMRGLRPGWRYKVLWFSSPEASQLILVAAAAVIMALSLVMTMSRSGISAFILSLVITVWFVGRTFESRARRLVASASLAVLVMIVVAWAGPEAIIHRFASGDWGEFNNRRGAWADAWSIARVFPVAGTGINSYWAAALFYQRHELDFFFAQAHNDYLQLAAEGGLLVVIPALVAIAVFAREVRQRMSEARGTTAWWMRAGAVTSLIAIACQEMVEFSLQMPGNAALFAVVCAIALHRPQAADNPSEAGVHRRPLRLVNTWNPSPRRADV
jgi:O-antigen ligase